MKKLMTSIFVAVLAFVSFGTSSAMAAGNSHADIFDSNGKSYNTIQTSKPLYNDPSNPNVVNYVSPVQNVHVITAAIKIDTWLGPKWVRYGPGFYGGAHDSLGWAFDASNAKLTLQQEMPLFDTATGHTATGKSVAPQTVNVKQAWYQIDTWLGLKWIGYNM